MCYRLPYAGMRADFLGGHVFHQKEALDSLPQLRIPTPAHGVREDLA